jgi:hypothetical protein
MELLSGDRIFLVCWLESDSVFCFRKLFVSGSFDNTVKVCKPFLIAASVFVTISILMCEKEKFLDFIIFRQFSFFPASTGCGR